MLKSAEVEIQKEHQVLMVNKTTKFKKQGKPKKDLKKGGKKAAAHPEKPKGGPKPDTDCYYCNGKGHWKLEDSGEVCDQVSTAQSSSDAPPPLLLRAFSGGFRLSPSPAFVDDREFAAAPAILFFGSPVASGGQQLRPRFRGGSVFCHPRNLEGLRREAAGDRLVVPLPEGAGVPASAREWNPTPNRGNT
ncbi:hypothetical protein QYE76_049474 [Lolium multiflorum]|uniref:Uncharacterized protein n=1 Tax=Lolium multiflorum TaxID=4521 RepID=A0AAD8WIC4_LOLMU|nr:hypothetical protein QYE76_049474 [Lolium multiflorum]